METQGPVRIKSYRFVPGTFRSLNYTRTETKMNIPGSFRGGLATFTINRYPKAIFCIWGADLRDFELMATRLLDINNDCHHV